MKVMLYFILLFLVISNSYSQWNAINEIQHYVNSIQTKNDSLFVATDNGVYYVDSLSDITLLDSGDTIKNVNKLQVIEDNIYAVSGENIYKYSGLESNWDSVCNTFPYDFYYDFYLKDSLLVISADYNYFVKNIFNDSTVFNHNSGIISLGHYGGSIEYFNSKFYIFSWYGSMQILDSEYQNIYLSSEYLKTTIPAESESAATDITKMTDKWLIAAYPCYNHCSYKGSVFWFDYKSNDTVYFNDSILLDFTPYCMDVYNEEIYIGGQDGIIAIINQMSKEIIKDTILNTSENVSDIIVNGNSIYCTINGELYHKEIQNPTLNANTQFASREQLHIYPTISESVIHIDDLIENYEYTIKIVNINGTTLYNGKMNYTNVPLTINIDNLSRGIYIIEVSSDEKHESAYIIKK